MSEAMRAELPDDTPCETVCYQDKDETSQLDEQF